MNKNRSQNITNYTN